ncbi:MAG: hypothetical protein AB1595_00380 [bacterium]
MKNYAENYKYILYPVSYILYRVSCEDEGNRKAKASEGGISGCAFGVNLEKQKIIDKMF